MKKGQSQLIGYVLLIGFTIVLGIMVGGWMIKQAGKSGEKAAERAELDVRCADVSIVGIYDADGNYIGIKNTGYFTISKLKVNGVDTGAPIPPNEEGGPSSIDLNKENTVIPFIKIEGKEYGCTSKSITIGSNV